MNNFNCIGRILKKSKIYLDNNKIPWIDVKLEVAQRQINSNFNILSGKVWGNLAYNLEKYYNINDYILIDGYFSITNKYEYQFFQNNITKIDINSICPFFLNSR